MTFQNNPLLIQLKKKMILKYPKIEGIVKSTKKNFGFLETNVNKIFFIPPKYMKNVMHGDRIQGYIKIEKNREIIYPEKLVVPFLTKFIGSIQKKNNFLFIQSHYPYVRNLILCNSKDIKKHVCEHGDWVMAELTEHPLQKKNRFYAIILKFIVKKINPLAPWYVILARHNLKKSSPNVHITHDFNLYHNEKNRTDLTHLNFITIDNQYTKDIDDAIFIKEITEKKFLLMVAIADPTEFVYKNTKLDKIAKKRSFTHYLPGFNIPMLPRKLSEDICSLKPFLTRPSIVCSVVINIDGSISTKKINFFLAWIQSKSKLTYENVSNWLEKKGTWIPENDYIKKQIILLKKIYDIRHLWRNKFAFIFPDKPEFRFHFSESWEVLNVSLESRRIAHRMIEEAMIAVNICAATFLSKKLGFGLYNIHSGFDIFNAINVCKFLKEYQIEYHPQEIMTLEGFCKLRRHIKEISNNYINYRLYRFQNFGEISLTPRPHYALGFPVYATWTSPIRKYSDLINHRLIKSIIKGEKNIIKPTESIINNIILQKRRTRLANRDLEDWLYIRFLRSYNHKKKIFQANIIDILRNGIRARLIQNGAFIFIPSFYIHNIQKELVFYPDIGMVYIRNKIYYRVSDIIMVYIVTIKFETKKIIACIA
ncbi:exoribonuclease II [Buchnera aphidicola]|uniref:Exoribonuclease II n=1 Tax=Buchnera aphidicola subsp. Tuberolachnus salignus TaxID=98804 RepID=A0A160SY62_BUCTT|nr:exoribonuclease II [Buchnera aphidicola]CUR53154.1 Exoribonuclease 2 [Buchnera aphidicola (Tuberolachnus salignus)]